MSLQTEEEEALSTWSHAANVVSLIMRHANEVHGQAGRRSSNRYNHARHAALQVVITTGLRFAPEDFQSGPVSASSTNLIVAIGKLAVGEAYGVDQAEVRMAAAPGAVITRIG